MQIQIAEPLEVVVMNDHRHQIAGELDITLGKQGSRFYCQPEGIEAVFDMPCLVAAVGHQPSSGIIRECVHPVYNCGSLRLCRKVEKWSLRQLSEGVICRDV